MTYNLLLFLNIWLGRKTYTYTYMHEMPKSLISFVLVISEISEMIKKLKNTNYIVIPLRFLLLFYKNK